MASIVRRFSSAERRRPSVKVGPDISEETVSGEMSINNGDDAASSESFWEVGKFMRTVNRIDNGYKLCSGLRNLITARAEIEKGYAQKLTEWSKKWNSIVEKGPEYGTTEGSWRGVLEEADRVAELHTEVADKLVNKVSVSIKQWQKENYHKSMMHFKETKEQEDQFRKVQKPWEKKLNKVLQAKKDYHNACRAEKSTANQENNARGDTALSSDQLKKLQEKLKKCQADVESTQDKYNACLNDLNAYNAKYIEDMTLVFQQCQEFERKRIEFFKKTLFDIHQCLDLSVDSRFSQVYTDLHQTISNTDADKDLKWWSNTHGSEMAMAWPEFEEYSPEFKQITGQGKKSEFKNESGITITSIKHTQNEFIPSSAQAVKKSSTNSSQKSSSSYSYNNTPAQDPDLVPQQNVSKQGSYDESLNPFGDDDPNSNEGEIRNENTNAEINSINNTPPSGGSNPFGDAESDLEEQASQGSGTGSLSKGDGSVTSQIPCRVLYAYNAEEEDEISCEAGEIIQRLSDQDDMGWVKARTNDGREGLIPYSYIQDIQ